MAHASWGPGWPNCQPSKIFKQFVVPTVQGNVGFPGGVRHEIRELVTRLVQETARRGYRFGRPGNPSYGCWGYNCRSISGTSKPSNHSWGLAVDINAPSNPYKAPLTTDMPSWMPDLWNAYGFRWGGDYTSSRKDAMHYEFLGSVADAVSYTNKARTNKLGEGTVPIPPKPQPPTPKPPVAVTGKATGWMNQAHSQVKQGDKNATVGHLQGILGVKVDNDFGPKTKSALVRRQRAEGIPADGICGDQTWGYIHPQIKRGAKGWAVSELQQSIRGVKVDSDFGPATHNALVAYQQAKKLTADGICGNKTWHVLCLDAGG